MVFLSLSLFLFLIPSSRVFAQYPTPTPSCTCTAGTEPVCPPPVGSFPVCNHTNGDCLWSCTEVDSLCTSWSDWSGCGPGICGETRYCTDPIFINDAESQYCPGECGNPGPTPTSGGGPTATPTPTPVPVTVRARGVVVPSGTTACATVNGSTSYISDTLYVTPGGPAEAQTVSGGTYASWSKTAGTYTVTDAPPTEYVLKLACWTTTVPAAQGTGLTADAGGGTLTWNLGYTLGVGWWQAQGGDVYASAALRSYVPSATAPRYAALDGNSGRPGVVQYGTTYDFDSGISGSGDAYISSEGWLANEAYAATDYYAVMLHRFGNPDADYTGDTTLTSELPSRADPYFVDGNLTISSSDWNATAGETIVVLVDGDLTINRKINLSGTGFIAFIVNGSITVDPTVGVLYSSSVPVLEGVYITSPTGTFSTGGSTSVGTERFVGEGMFIAGSFNLGRDLDSVGQNNTTAAELFIYNPQLLITMPDKMRNLPVTWSEVAP